MTLETGLVPNQPFTAATSEPNPYSFDFDFNQERQDSIVAMLDAYNKAHTLKKEGNRDGRFTSEPIQLFALNPEGRLVGGLLGRTHHSQPEWLDVLILVVDEPNRGCGLGRELMKRTEEEAYNKGCRFARLATGLNQAPGFYEKLGYSLYGTMENFPRGSTVCLYLQESGKA